MRLLINVVCYTVLYPDFYHFIAAMEPSLYSASVSDTSVPLIVGSTPDTQNAHQDTDTVSKDLKDQELICTEEGGIKQDSLECVPTSTISDSKSTILSEILTQSAGESLVDLTIDPQLSRERVWSGTS